MRGFQSEACVNSRVTRVGVTWRGYSSMNSCVTQLFLNEQFKQLRGAAVGWRSASAKVRYAVVLLSAQLGQSCVTRLLRRVTRLCGYVNLGKARSGGSAIDASAFWDLLDPPMRARVVAAGFEDYAAGLRRTQPRFPPAMRYALMERWNDCTHAFVFGFSEMTLTPDQPSVWDDIACSPNP
ncbi:hypothetical protein JCGZ_11955 [Jatropha curcas]|uniref:Aminotransferase-like plant mobile domain-containing protein n=1 Tax=Jatropha curcas TaxID=180498 RepID=A0A067KET7_JATCU|nr:hypothetical protein JCGZ_11955 [Jatropha curcas]